MFVDYLLMESKCKNGQTFKKKVLVNTEDHLSVVVKKAIKAVLQKDNPAVGDDNVDEVMKCLKPVSCHGFNLTEYIEESMDDLKSANTPVFKRELDIDCH